MKKYLLRLTLAISFSSFLITSCNNPEEDKSLQDIEKKSLSITQEQISARTGTMSCYISGSTVSNVNSNNAFSTVSPGSTTTYQYNSNPVTSNITWSIVSANPSGSITINGSGTSVNVTFSSNFISGSIQAIGTDSTGQICGPVLPINTSNGGNGGDCTCPNPIIKCDVAVSGGHPYWRFHLEGLEDGDTAYWTQLNAPFIGNPNIGAMPIANPTGPNFMGFTIYCEVTRTCPNGTVKKRKAFYTNYYGGDTQTGKTGFVNIGNVCDAPSSGDM